MTQKNVKATIKTENELYKLIKISLILIILFIVFYMITNVITKNQKNNSSGYSADEKIAAIQYDKILVGTMLNQKRDEYFVLLDKDGSDDFALCNSYVKVYLQNDKALKVFAVDMNDPFNKNYYGENSNVTEELSDFKINKITMIKVKNGSIVDVYDGKDSIVTEMKNLSK